VESHEDCNEFCDEASSITTRSTQSETIDRPLFNELPEARLSQTGLGPVPPEVLFD